jgi:hypothetical protein
VAVAAIVAFWILLGAAVWRETGALRRERSPEPT